MKRVLTVPANLDERAFDALLADARDASAADCLLDARRLRWADPYGMIGLLALGKTLGAQGARPVLQLPESADVLSYLDRMAFFREAEALFELHGAPRPRRNGGPSNVLLEITPIRSHEDVHGVIDHILDRAGIILVEKLGYRAAEAAFFGMILSEVCQNVVEHAEAGGWVGIQAYNWSKRLSRQVVVIAVMDLGVGFRGSLTREHAARFGDRWGDATALEAAFLHGVSRFRDPGRGQGLKQIRARVVRWGGKISIRSGTARIAQVPEWDDAPPLESGLAPLPGAQILIVIPAREPAGGGATAGAR